MVAILVGIALLTLPNNDPYIAIPVGGDCSYQLLDMGYRGIAGDGMEAVYAPRSIVLEVCK